MAERGGRCCPPMDLIRSEAMQLIIPIESAHLAVSYLGDLGLVRFKDLNAKKSPFQLTYAIQIKRCGEMGQNLRFFRDQMIKAGLVPAVTSPADIIAKLDDLEIKLGDLEAELVEINANGEKLQRSYYNELVKYKLVLQKAGELFQSALSSAVARQREYASSQGRDESMEIPLLYKLQTTTDSSKQVKLGFITGVLPRQKSMAFERVLFRATKGNVFLKQVSMNEPVLDPLSGEKVETIVFVVFFSGERSKRKIVKLCEVLRANRYSFTEDLSKQSQKIVK